MNKIKPLVSIICTVYNHESFLRNALDGFVMQKTNFPFEIIISDDASTDSSADIIREYEKKYPKLFVPFYYKENQYSKGIPFFANDLLAKSKGKYIALCEGDDYWTDPYKLQKQVDFLEANKDFAICATNAMQINGKTETILGYSEDCIFEHNDFILGNRISTLTVVFRNLPVVLDKNYRKCIIGDWPLWLLISEYGKVKQFKDITAVYRVHSQGEYSGSSDLKRRYMILKTQFYINKITKNKYQNKIIPLLYNELKNIIFRNVDFKTSNNKFNFIQLYFLTIYDVYKMKMINKLHINS